MTLTIALSQVAKTGVVDDGHVLAVADALERLGGAELAERFVNKALSDADVQSIQCLPSSAMRDRLLKFNATWRSQTWTSHHPLAKRGAKPPPPPPQTTSAPVVAKLKARVAELEEELKKSAAERDALDGQVVGLKGAYAKDTEAFRRKIAELEAAYAKDAGEADRLKKAFSDETVRLKDELAREMSELKSAHDDERRKLADRIAELEGELKKSAVAAVAAAAARPASSGGKPGGSLFVFPDLHRQVQPIWKEMGANSDATRVVLFFLGAVISESENANAFANRFKPFDDELYALLHADAAKLGAARREFGKILEERVSVCKATWDLVGEPYNQENHYCPSVLFSAGDMKVAEVQTALLRDAQGERVRKAKVVLVNESV